MTSTTANGTPQKSWDIAVVGGGIAGLTLTIALLHKGLTVTLYEAAHKFGEIGAGVSFGPNACRAMALIDPAIKEGFDRRATYNQSPEKADFWFDMRWGMGKNGDDSRVGKLITQVSCPPNEAKASVHRAHFLDEMVKLVPESVSKFGKRLEDAWNVEDGVMLKFADGTEAKHSAVVACDGIKSRARQVILGKDNPSSHAVFTGKYCYRGLIPMDQAKELLGAELASNSQMYFGEHGHMLTFPVEKGKTMNVVAFHSQDKWEDDQWVIHAKKEDMFKDYEAWGKQVKDILSLMQKPDIWALFNHPPADTYYKGRICLLGDSAHASTPHQGAGAGMAIEDAYVMANLLAQVDDTKDIERAFKSYDYIRRPRTQKLVTTSKEAGQLYDLELVGDDEEKLKQILNSRMDWIWKEDLQGELKEAQKVYQENSKL